MKTMQLYMKKRGPHYFWKRRNNYIILTKIGHIYAVIPVVEFTGLLGFRKMEYVCGSLPMNFESMIGVNPINFANWVNWHSSFIPSLTVTDCGLWLTSLLFFSLCTLQSKAFTIGRVFERSSDWTAVLFSVGLQVKHVIVSFLSSGDELSWLHSLTSITWMLA